MKTIVSAFVLSFALVASAPGAEAHAAHHHHHHYYHHHHHFYYHHHYHHHYHYIRHYGEYGAPVPPPYTYYYPPMPASIFDVPPEDRLPANTLQWLMNAENDPPFAEAPRYPYYRYYPYYR